MFAAKAKKRNSTIGNLKSLSPSVMVENGVTAGNASPVLSSLRFLGVVNKEGLVIDDDFYRLGDSGDERPQTYNRILRRAYAELVNLLESGALGERKIVYHFTSGGVS